MELAPNLLRATLAHLPLRGVPSLLTGLTRRLGAGSARLCRIDTGDWLELDFSDPDQCMMFHGLYSRGVDEVARRLLRPGDTVWDIGGQLGYFATRFARLVGPSGSVVSFEPDPHAFARLQRGIHKTGHRQLQARPWAITAESATVTLRVSPTVGWSSLVEFDEPLACLAEVSGYAIDELVEAGELDPAGLRLIKLDIEGGELAALQGMRHTLANSSTALICEFNLDGLGAAGQTPADLIGFFHQLGMTTYAIRMPAGLVRTGGPYLSPVRSVAEIPFALGDLLCLPVTMAPPFAVR